MQNISDPSPRVNTTPQGPLQLHGVLVRLERTGVLLLGESGTGKSACALELMSSGHQLVADDVVEVSRRGNRLIGKAPPITRDLLAVRGLGIVNVRDLFGESVVEPESHIDLCVEIVEPADANVANAVGGCTVQSILGCRIPRLLFASESAGDLATLIRAAVRHHKTAGSSVPSGSLPMPDMEYAGSNR